MNYPPPPPRALPPLPPVPAYVPTEVVQQVNSLPGLVKSAANRLANATNAAEVLDAKAQANFAYDAAKAAARFAKAKGAYDEVIGAVYRAQADALEIEATAKRRLADEVDAAQDRGELPKRGQHRAVLGDNKIRAALSDAGLDHDSILEARQARDAEVQVPGIVRESLDSIIVSGYEPTKAALGREINSRLQVFSGDNEWYTPARYIQMAREVMGAIDCDPASNERAQSTINATVYFTEQMNGLDKDWSGRVWMNPPYAHPAVQQFADKLISEIAAGRVTEAVVLTNASVDTAWHHRLQNRCALMCCTSGRIKFESGSGRESAGNAVGQTFLYFGPNVAKFAKVFGDVGSIWQQFISPPPH